MWNDPINKSLEYIALQSQFLNHPRGQAPVFQHPEQSCHCVNPAWGHFDPWCYSFYGEFFFFLTIKLLPKEKSVISFLCSSNIKNKNIRDCCMFGLSVEKTSWTILLAFSFLSNLIRFQWPVSIYSHQDQAQKSVALICLQWASYLLKMKLVNHLCQSLPQRETWPNLFPKKWEWIFLAEAQSRLAS